MELRHLETLIAIDEEGTFTAAADALRTVQSNVSEQVRQLEAELGVTLLARGRSGATPTESGQVVLNHARRIRRELQMLQEDVAALQGLQVGRASFGIVGTAIDGAARHASTPPNIPPCVPPPAIQLTARLPARGSKRSLTKAQKAAITVDPNSAACR